MPRLPRPTRLAAAALTLVATTALAGCSSSEGDKTPGAAPETLTLAIGGEDEAGYDPTMGWGRYGSPLFQSTLLVREPDLSISNDLATDHRVSKDGLTWTVDLRTDATFTDGTPVTAADVAYTFNTASKQGGLTDVTVLERAEVTGEHQVTFTLEQPQSTFIHRLVSLGIVPEHAHDADYAAHPVGSGPYKFVDWQRGQQLVVERNDDYYGEKPAFERLTFLFTDEDASLAAAKAGQVDVAAVPAALATQQIDGMRLQAVTSIDNRGITFPTVPDQGKKSPAGEPIGNDVTADVAIRQAVNFAVDRQELVDGVLEGFGSPATGPVDNSPWYQPSTAIEDDDPARAEKILDEAGWKDSDGDGVREKDGRKAAFTLLYPATDSLRQGLALSVVDQVRPTGIEITAEGVGWDEIYARQHVDAALFGWGSHDPKEMYNLYLSTMAGVESYNVGYYANDTVDAHLRAAMEATDQDTATEQWRLAQDDGSGHSFGAEGDAAWAWLVNLEHTYFVDSCLDLGEIHTEPHGHGWPITTGITGWRWSC